jgi:hypothetical protein
MSKRKSSPLGDLLGASPQKAPPTPLAKDAPVEVDGVKIEEKSQKSPEKAEASAPTRPVGKGKPRRGGSPREGLQRVRYDLPPEIKAAVDDRALITGVASSQMVAFLLAHALHIFDEGKLDPSPYFTRTRSPKFRHNLDVTYPLHDDSQ